jgi:hypothetical protein
MPTPPKPSMPSVKAVGHVGGASGVLKGAPHVATLEKKGIQTRLPGRAPVHSALVRQKSLAGKGLKSGAGDLKKAKGGVKGTAGKELTHVKKASLPAHKLAAKDAAGLKKAAGLKSKAALKATAPSHSALVRQKKLAGHKLAGGRSTIGKDMSGLKKAHQGQAASLGKKVGAVAHKAKPKFKGVPKFGRLLRGGSQRPQ